MQAIQLSDHFTRKRLLRFSLPSIVMMVFTSIYGVVDGYFVSNYTGKTPFAAVNLIMPFLMILGGVEELFADVVSRAALDLFAAAGKAVAYTVAVPHIINRADDGICPVERLCAEAQTAGECLPLIEGFIRKMQERNE